MIDLKMFKKDKLVHHFQILYKNKEDRYFDYVTETYHSSKFIDKWIKKMDNWELVKDE